MLPFTGFAVCILNLHAADLFFVLKDYNTCQIIMLFADLPQIWLCIFMHYFLHIYAFFS